MPDISAYKVDHYLTDLSVGYSNEEFINEIVCPVKLVNSRTGIYWVSDRSAFTPEYDYRAPGSRAREVTHVFTQASFSAREHALNHQVTWEERDEARVNNIPFEPYEEATNLVTEKVGLQREITVATAYRSTAFFTQNATLSGTAQWNDYTNSDPVANVQTGQAAIRASIGRRANTAIVPDAVYQKLLFHTKLLNLMSTAGTRMVTDDFLRTIFQVDRIIVPKAIQNTANPAQTFASADIWGKDVILLYLDPNQGLRSLQPARTFRVRYQTTQPAEVRRWTENDKKADYVEAGVTEDRARSVVPTAAYLIKTAIA